MIDLIANRIQRKPEIKPKCPMITTCTILFNIIIVDDSSVCDHHRKRIRDETIEFQIWFGKLAFFGRKKTLIFIHCFFFGLYQKKKLKNMTKLW